jgi:hypothetical protein
MAKKEKSKKKFVQLFHEMMESEAWRGLSCHARVIYTEIRKKYNGANLKDLSFTYSEAAKIMHRDTYSKALKELVDNGLINVVESGGLPKRPNIFSLSERWRYYGTANFFKADRKVPPKKW